jgi:hypothetical protein
VRPDRVAPTSSRAKRPVACGVGFVFRPPEVVMGGEQFGSVDLETKAVAIREWPSRNWPTLH